MSYYATPADLEYAPPLEFEPAYDPSQFAATSDPASGAGRSLTTWFIERSRWTPLPFLLPTALLSISWAGNGIQFLTDVGMVFLAAMCTFCLVVELIRFPQRFGIGGFVVFGGTLIWFCHDYLYTWFGYNGRSSIYQPWVIAKAAFLVSLLTFSMAVGLNIRAGKWMTKLVSVVPEAGSSGFYLCLLVFLFTVGVSPYFLFTKEPFYKAIYQDMTGLRTTAHAQWTVARSGLLNDNWASYVLHLLDIGWFSGMFGAFYATLVARSLSGRIVGWAAFGFWMLLAFGSGTRGVVVALALPALGFLYIKYHIQAAAMFRRYSLRAYVVCGVLAFGMLAIIQFQGMFRGLRADRRQWSQLELAKPRGNHMFSEGLLAAQEVPGTTPFFNNRFIGEGAVRVIPETAFYALIHPIPRALWTGKPVDPAWRWYNQVFTKERWNNYNTTIAPGLAVGQYMRYGLAGVLEYGILFGWLAACSERVLRSANGRPIQILTSLALAVWLFRSFRGGLGWMELYELVIGLTAMSLIVILGRPFLNRE